MSENKLRLIIAIRELIQVAIEDAEAPLQTLEAIDQILIVLKDLIQKT